MTGTRRRAPLPRLIDLHIAWHWQYIGETTQFDPSHYPPMAGRLDQVAGYLGATAAAVVSCSRTSTDWASQADPWATLDQTLTRIDAEFPGRLLIGPDDHARWQRDPDGLTWALVGIAGFDQLVRVPGDLDRLGHYFERGVRLFQPVQGPGGTLGGSAAPGEHQGLSELGRDFLRVLVDVAPGGAGPRPLLDLAALNPVAIREVLSWYEADSERANRLPPVFSHGAIGRGHPGALDLDLLTRLRALGGIVGLSVGPPDHESTEALRAAFERAAEVPFRGRAGYEGLGIGTNFLGMERAAPGLGDAEAVVAWLVSTFDAPTADRLIQQTGRQLIGAAVGVVDTH